MVESSTFPILSTSSSSNRSTVQVHTNHTAVWCAEGGLWTEEVLEAGIEGAFLCPLAKVKVAAVASDTCLPGGLDRCCRLLISTADSSCTGR